MRQFCVVLSYQRHTVTSEDKAWQRLAFVSCFDVWNGFCQLNLVKGGCRVTGCCHIATAWVGWRLPHIKKNSGVFFKRPLESEVIFQSISDTKKLAVNDCTSRIYSQIYNDPLMKNVYKLKANWILCLRSISTVVTDTSSSHAVWQV